MNLHHHVVDCSSDETSDRKGLRLWPITNSMPFVRGLQRSFQAFLLLDPFHRSPVEQVYIGSSLMCWMGSSAKMTRATS